MRITRSIKTMTFHKGDLSAIRRYLPQSTQLQTEHSIYGHQRSKSSPPPPPLPPPIEGLAGSCPCPTLAPPPELAGPHSVLVAFSFSRSLIVFFPALAASGAPFDLAPVPSEVSEVIHRSSKVDAPAGFEYTAGVEVVELNDGREGFVGFGRGGGDIMLEKFGAAVVGVARTGLDNAGTRFWFCAG